MKRLTVLLILCLAIGAVSYAAISAAMEWDVRTTGSDANGGGFKRGATGTDYSQQDAAQQAYTDIVIGATTTQLTSVLFPFDATSVGNVINITGGVGCTVGRYEVASLSVITVTMDRSVGTAASVCTGNLGGSLLTIATANTVMVTSNTIFIKAGTYTQTTALSTPYPAYIVGFQTNHNDGGTRPLVTTATNSTTLWLINTTLSGSVTTSFNNINVSNTASTRAIGMYTPAGSLQSLIVQNSIWDGFTTALDFANASGYYAVGVLTLSNVEIKNCTQAAVNTANGSGAIGSLFCYACYIHSNTGGTAAMLAAGPADWTFVDSIIADNTKTGINATLGAGITVHLYNSVVARNGNNGVDIANQYVDAQNTIFYGNTGTAVSVSSSAFAGAPTTATGHKNAYGANGANRNYGLAGSDDIALSASPFTSATDFSLNSTAGGGLLLQKTGWTAMITGSTTLGTLDVGAIQGSQGTVAGAVSSAFVQ